MIYRLTMEHNNSTPSQDVFKEYLNLELQYSRHAFENLAKGIGGDNAELRRFLRGLLAKNVLDKKCYLHKQHVIFSKCIFNKP